MKKEITDGHRGCWRNRHHDGNEVWVECKESPPPHPTHTPTHVVQMIELAKLPFPCKTNCAFQHTAATYYPLSSLTDEYYLYISAVINVGVHHLGFNTTFRVMRNLYI